MRKMGVQIYTFRRAEFFFLVVMRSFLSVWLTQF
jgi:hypothetical protein